MSRSAFGKLCTDANKGGVALAAGALCLYDEKYLFINGDAFVIQGDATFWRQFADARSTVVPTTVAKETIDALYAWYCDGWLMVGTSDKR
jgi:hypothetical protein